VNSDQMKAHSMADAHRSVSLSLQLILGIWLYHGHVGASTPALTTSAYVTSDDVDLYNKSTVKMSKACAGNQKIEISKDKTVLESQVGGENMMINALKKAKKPAEVGDKLKDEAKPASLIFSAGPIVMFFLVLIVYLFCCWSWWPCCRCCRFCATRSEQGHSKPIKLSFVIVIVAIFAAVAFNGFYMSLGGYRSAVDGIKVVDCAAATLVHDSLGGSSGPNPFVGLLPFLNVFAKLGQDVTPNSPFLRSVSAILRDTSEIDTSLTVALGTLQLVKDMVEEPVNRLTSDKHQCPLCTQMGSTLSQTIQLVNNGVAKQLANTRQTIDRELNNATSLSTLGSSVNSSMKPVETVKKGITSLFKPFVTSAGVNDAFNSLGGTEGNNSVLRPIILALVLLAMFIIFCGCISSGCCFFNEKKTGDGTNNPYNKSVHCCAAGSWCCGFQYAMCVFLFGGILSIVAFLGSTVCLTFLDMNTKLMTDISPALGMSSNISNIAVLDGCIFNPTNNPNLFELVKVNDNGQQKTIKDMIYEKTVVTVNNQFTKLSAVQQNSSTTLAASTQMTSLKSFFSTYYMDAAFVPVSDMQSDSAYSALAQDPQNKLVVGYSTSMRCSDFSASGYPSVPGITNFVNELSRFGVVTGDEGGCAKTVTCSNPSSQVCNAARNYMTLKNNILTKQFRCDLFENPNNPTQSCDIKDMSCIGTACTNDCLNSAGQLNRKQISCNLNQYVSYMRHAGTRIDNAIKLLDSAAASVQPRISTNLKGLVDTSITNPINDTLNRASCALIAREYNKAIDGLCYKGMVGFVTITRSYIICAAFVLLFTLVMYIAWRRSIDNYNAWSSEKK